MRTFSVSLVVIITSAVMGAAPVHAQLLRGSGHASGMLSSGGSVTGRLGHAGAGGLSAAGSLAGSGNASAAHSISGLGAGSATAGNLAGTTMGGVSAVHGVGSASGSASGSGGAMAS